jgi:serine/threonine protein kinase
MKDPELLKEAVKALGGEFELIRKLGQGATSVVYLHRDHALDRDVAMKVIRATFAGDDEAMARLQREAHLVAQLTHPNIVKLYGTHRLTDGSFALFMEHVPGRNLKEILRAEGAFSVQRTMRVLTDVASALAYAHRRRIVHRDVKLANVPSSQRELAAVGRLRHGENQGGSSGCPGTGDNAGNTHLHFPGTGSGRAD